MALHPNFPESPYAILDPAVRWFPADEALRGSTSDKLMPPLVSQLRQRVKVWRDSGYDGAADTSRSLLNWWFNTPHLMPQADGTMAAFEYYFAQREALETIVYLYDVVGVQDKFDLMRFDSSGAVSAGMFDETWRRFVVKMATGSGKTKVLSLALAWSFYHKLYEPESGLARNFLVIAPNIIVLDRIYKDFQGLRIFLKDDPVLPDNGFDGRNWRDDFQLTLHVQDDVRVRRADRQHLPDQHPPRLRRQRYSRFARRRKHDGLFSRQAAQRRDHGLQDRSRHDRARHRRADGLERRGAPHPRPAHGLVQVHRRHSQPLEAKRVCPVAANRRDRDAAAQQRSHLRADDRGLSAGRGHLAERGEASRPARRRQPRQTRGAPERQVHREIRRLHSSGRHRVAQDLSPNTKAGQESHAVRDDRRHPELRRRGRLPARPPIRNSPKRTRSWSFIPRATARFPNRRPARAKKSCEKLRKQANAIDALGQPRQGHRLGDGAEGRLGRAQRDDDRRVCGPIPPKQHPARANARARLAENVSRRCRGICQRRRHERLHGIRRIDPGRRRGAGTQADGRGHPAEAFHWSSRSTRKTTAKTSMRWISKFPC